MNIVKVNHELSVVQTEFKYLRIAKNNITNDTNKIRMYSLRLKYGDAEEYEIMSFYSCQQDLCQLWYYRYLYLFSINKEVGVIEFTYEDTKWFNQLCSNLIEDVVDIDNVVKNKQKNKMAKIELVDKYRDVIKEYIFGIKYK